MNEQYLDNCYKTCVKFYNDAFRADNSWIDITYFIEKYINNREALIGTCYNDKYKDGGRFDYVTILEKMGVKSWTAREQLRNIVKVVAYF